MKIWLIRGETFRNRHVDGAGGGLDTDLRALGHASISLVVAAAVLAGGTVVAFGAPGGAQSDDPPVDLVSVGLPAAPDTADNIRPALSDTGAVVAFVSIPAASGPETAVDLDCLESLAAHDIRFTILAPHQASHVRPLEHGVLRPDPALRFALASGVDTVLCGMYSPLEVDTNLAFAGTEPDEAERAALDFALAASQIPNTVNEDLKERLHKYWDEGEIVEMLGVILFFG